MFANTCNGEIRNTIQNGMALHSSAIVRIGYLCLNLDCDEGGYFAAPRLVLSYVDYLGALHHGYDGRIMDGKIRRGLANFNNLL